MNAAAPSWDELVEQARQLGELARAAELRVATAESCTGGLAAAAMTAVAGSSEWFERGFVVYSNRAKTEMLGVDADLIERHGDASLDVALAMAQGALKRGGTQLAVAITGIAGPDGGTEDKPVGTVWVVAASSAGAALGLEGPHQFAGDRAAVRLGSVAEALRVLRRMAATP